MRQIPLGISSVLGVLRRFTQWNILPWLVASFFMLQFISIDDATTSPTSSRAPHLTNSLESSKLPFPKSQIRVLPPSPDDTPQECHVNATRYETCGAERFCSLIPTQNSRQNDNHNNQSASNQTLLGLFLDYSDYYFDGNRTEPFTPTTYYCLHKTLWYPKLDIRDVAAFLLCGTCCFLAAMAGIGGGGLMLPVLLMSCNFTPKEASVLSNTAVFCNTFGQFIINNSNLGKKPSSNVHSRNNQVVARVPDSSSALVWATVLMIMPGVIAGGSIAITLEGMVPSTVILILAFLTLLLASIKTYHKAKKMRKAEQIHEDRALHVEIALPSQALETQSPQPNDDGDVDVEEDAALIASALEWGSVLAGEGGSNNENENNNMLGTPCSRLTQASDLLDEDDSQNKFIMGERFFGSIRYLNKELSEDNCALIVDESSIVRSFDQDDEEELDGVVVEEEELYGVNRSRETLNSGHSVISHVGLSGRCCYFLYSHKLQLFIAGFWILDATTFLLLHSSSLVPHCSPLFFVMIGLPAVTAVVFVSAGRCYLLSQQIQPSDERRPLFARLLSGSQDEEDDNAEDDFEAVPSILQTQGERSRRSRAPVDRNWVLLVPLISVFAGILKSFQGHRQVTRQRGRGATQRDGDQPDNLLPFLTHSNSEDSGSTTNDVGTTTSHVSDLHDNYNSLLAWWLPSASILIGLLSALLGIGGGELLGPILLLLLKMDPKQSSATTAIMSMMNSGTNLLHYIVADMMLAPGYAINLGLVGFAGGSGGRIWAMSMAQHGKSSVIAMSLCGVLSLATLLVVWELFTTPMSWQSSVGVC